MFAPIDVAIAILIVAAIVPLPASAGNSCADTSLRCVVLPRDAAAFWTMLQFFALTAAAAVALWQIIATRKAQCLANAVELSKSYFFWEMPIIPSMAFTRLSSVDFTKVEGADKLYGADPNSAPEDIKDFLREILTAVDAVHNFFDNAEDQYRRNVIDRDYFLGRFDSLIEPSAKVMRQYYSLMLWGPDKNVKWPDYFEVEIKRYRVRKTPPTI